MGSVRVNGAGNHHQSATKRRTVAEVSRTSLSRAISSKKRTLLDGEVKNDFMRGGWGESG
jgi:hypothetical protein